MENSPIFPETGGADGGTASDEVVIIARSELDELRARAAAASAADTRNAPRRPSEHTGEPEGRGGSVKVNAREVDAEGSGWEARYVRELDARDRRLAELEEACKAAVRDRELATALVGKPLVAGAASQLLTLWRDKFDVYEEGGGYKVAAGDGRPPAQVVGDWLASADYAHFCLPTSRGGTGARDASRPSSAGSAAAAPRNLGESVVMRWREESAARPNNLLKPIGLRRHR